MAQILLVEDDAAASELIQQYTEVLCGKHQLTIFSTATALSTGRTSILLTCLFWIFNAGLPWN